MTYHPNGKPRHIPEALGDVLKSFLKSSGLEPRIEQAAVIPEWPALVGTRVAAETTPLYVTVDGTLFVAVRTNAWMTELQLMVPELLAALNNQEGRTPVRKLRFVLQRDGA